MRVEFNRSACAGWFNCLDHWDALDMNVGDGKADLKDGKQKDEGVFVLGVSPEEESDILNAAESCPTHAIHVYKNDERIFPRSG